MVCHGFCYGYFADINIHLAPWIQFIRSNTCTASGMVGHARIYGVAWYDILIGLTGTWTAMGFQTSSPMPLEDAAPVTWPMSDVSAVPAESAVFCFFFWFSRL